MEEVKCSIVCKWFWNEMQWKKKKSPGEEKHNSREAKSHKQIKFRVFGAYFLCKSCATRCILHRQIMCMLNGLQCATEFSLRPEISPAIWAILHQAKAVTHHLKSNSFGCHLLHSFCLTSHKIWHLPLCIDACVRVCVEMILCGTFPKIKIGYQSAETPTLMTILCHTFALFENNFMTNILPGACTTESNWQTHMIWFSKIKDEVTLGVVVLRTLQTLTFAVHIRFGPYGKRISIRNWLNRPFNIKTKMHRKK